LNQENFTLLEEKFDLKVQLKIDKQELLLLKESYQLKEETTDSDLSLGQQIENKTSIFKQIALHLRRNLLIHPSL